MTKALDNTGENSTRREVLWVCLIALVAMTVRLLYLSGWAANPLFHLPMGDELSFHRTALALIDAPGLPWWVKGGIMAVAAGLAILLVSVVRERVYVRRRTRYKDVVR